MNCSLASLEISTEQVHQNKAVNLGESPQVEATNYTHADTFRKLEPHILVNKADVTVEEVNGFFKFLAPEEI